ncbi:MAG: excisionase family DNA-binding protein [Acidimicrobiales bacterium]|nr:excisionase family DNA-binding protein [Acidimicrobiales bacterium]RZV45131.1 MAG: helix-turn-helix domain-containing protein [Acidimicrobiales bacterium]
MTSTITLTEAAEQLGVHYMTAYRYVRTGRLYAEKVGGQWVVSTDDLKALKEKPAKPQRAIDAPVQLERRLLAGDEAGSVQILEDAMAAGADAEEVYLDILRPSLATVGKRWADGEISIADEHIATTVAHRVLARLGSRMTARGRSRGTILLAVVQFDQHSIPTAMLRDLLQVRGFDVVDLGANTPSGSIIERAAATPDLLAIGLAATHKDNDAAITETLNALHAATDVPVVLGGSAIRDAEHGRSLGQCTVSTSPLEAIERFEEIHAAAHAA